MSTVITPPLTSFIVPYPDFASRLANAIVYANSSEYPAASSLKIEQRYDSDNNTFVPSVSTILIYPQMTLLTKSIENTNASSLGDTASIDAFSRLRVSTIEALEDSKQIFDNLPFVFDTFLSGATTSTWVSGDACTILATASAGDFGIRQTFEHFNYSPGKSQLIFCSGVFSSQTNIIKRVGYFTSGVIAPFNDLEGYYFENNSGTLSFNIANPNGTASSQNITRTNWNVDKLDGTGPSGITLDISKTQIIVIDFEWLGVGRVRMGFVIDGKIYYCHYFNNANNLSNVYLRMPNLPIRYEIRQTGPGSGSLTHICASVNSENSGLGIGSPLAISTGYAATTFTKNQNNVLFAVKPTLKGSNISIDALNILTDSNINIRYEVVINPTFSSPLSFSPILSGALLSASGNGSITSSGGYPIYVGYTNQTGSSLVTVPADVLRFGFKIDGTADTLAINVYTFGANNAIIYGSLNLRLLQ